MLNKKRQSVYIRVVAAPTAFLSFGTYTYTRTTHQIQITHTHTLTQKEGKKRSGREQLEEPGKSACEEIFL